tara:strand:+ start:9068 stop:9337 length:270 start_codon:yes stop_codon:yes gene_type:complete
MSTGFSYHHSICYLQLSLPPAKNAGVCGLDYLFAIFVNNELRHFPFSLYTFPIFLWGLARDCHFQQLLKEGFPEFEKFYFPDFSGSTQI